MFRRSLAQLLKGRPKTAPTEVGCNRMLEEPWLTKSNDMFALPDFPNKPVMHNLRYFLYPGKAATGPPLGQDFSTIGIKAMDFAKAFNDRTKGIFKEDVPLVVRIQVYYDKTYTWRIEPPPIAWYLLRAVRKKRRETGPLALKQRYTAFITLEMCYEIAKCRGTWNKENAKGSKYWPSIEEHVRDIATRARLMGLAIIGVDTPDAPVKGVTAAQYEKQCAEYRKQQWGQWQAYKVKELEDDSTPLYTRLHSPTLDRLPRRYLENTIKNRNHLSLLWKASAPRSQSFIKATEEKRLTETLRTVLDMKDDLTSDEYKALLFNWRLPSVERVRQLKGTTEPTEMAWRVDPRDIEK
jgi:ribosomal protein L11